MLSDNPWAESFLQGELVFETQFLIYALGYVLVSLVGNWCRDSYHAAVEADDPKSIPDGRSIKALVASRPTVIAANIHSVATSVVAVGILVLYYSNQDDGGDNSHSPWVYRGTDLIKAWQTIGLPISLSYFATDSYFYCLPRKDAIIFVHHLIMMFCHYPVGSDRGAVLCGAGDVEWVTWLSIVGYTSEVATVLMNYRWYLINTLEENWIGFGIVNGLVVASWAGRVVMFAHLLVAEIFPRMHAYAEAGQLVTFGWLVLGHAGIGLLSLHWCIVMCRGGLRSLFVFEKKRPKVLDRQQQGFSFADEVAGKNNNGASSSNKGKEQMMTTGNRLEKIVEEEAQAYKDGTIFSEGQAQARQSKKLQ